MPKKDLSRAGLEVPTTALGGDTRNRLVTRQEEGEGYPNKKSVFECSPKEAQVVPVDVPWKAFNKCGK